MGEITLYVSPNGNDSWSGDFADPTSDGRDGPYATLERARSRVRELVEDGLAQPVTVLLREGTYHLDSTLELGSEVSGAETCPVSFAGFPGERAAISGGRTISGWRKADGDVWETDDVPANGRFRTMRVGDTQAIRARFPSFDPNDPIQGGWLFADWWGKPWELGRFDMPIESAKKAGDWIEWEVEVPVTAQYRVWIRYAKTEVEPVASAFGSRKGERVALEPLEATGAWHAFAYAAGGVLELDAGMQRIYWENTSGGQIDLDTVVLCSDPNWDPVDNVRITGWHTREYEVDEPAAGHGYLVVQTEALSSSSEGVGQPIPPGHSAPGSEPPGLRDRLRVKSGDLPNWRSWDGAEIHIFPSWGWMNRTVTVERVDPETRTIFGKFEDDVRPGNRYYITGTRAALTDPGEWCFDREAGRILYIPRDGESEVTEAVAALLTNAIRISGKHIHLRDLVICDTDYQFEGGYHPGTDCGVLFTGAEECSVERCTFECVGGWGVALNERASHIRVAENVMYGNGQGGVIFVGKSDEDRPVSNTIVGNDIADCGRVFAHVAGVYLATGAKNRIAHNRIRRMPRYGISLKSPGSHENVIEYNEIRDVNRETNDAGAIEHHGPDKKWSGNIYRHNIIVNSLGLKTDYLGRFMTPHYAWGIYLDDWASGSTIVGNIIVNNSVGGVNMHGGWDNRIENNILVNGLFRQLSLSPIFSDINSTTLRNNIVKRNVIAYTQKESTFIWCRPKRWYPEILKECDYNVYWCFGDLDLESPDESPTPVGSMARWRELGFDANTIVAAPRFTNPENGDYTLRDDSPAYRLGFKRIPVEKIGLSGYRSET